MALDQTLNKVLKEMWRLDEKLATGEELTVEEKGFYDANLGVIKNYYVEQGHYWGSK